MKVLKISKPSYSLHGHSRSPNYLPNELDTPRCDLILYIDLSCSNMNRQTIFKRHDSSPGVNPLNWIVPFWVLSKLKSRPFRLYITLFVNSTFIKILPLLLNTPSFSVILQVVRDAHVLHHTSEQQKVCLFSQNSISSYSKHGSVWYPSWCWKTHPFPCFCVRWWIQMVKKWPPRGCMSSCESVWWLL